MAGKLALRVVAVLMLCGAVLSEESPMTTIQCKTSAACFPNEGKTKTNCSAPKDGDCRATGPECYSLAVYTTKGGKSATLLTDRGCKGTPIDVAYVRKANFTKHCSTGKTICTSGVTLTSGLRDKVKTDLQSGNHTLCVKCCNTTGCNNDIPPQPTTKPPAAPTTKKASATPKPKPQPSNAKNTLPSSICNVLAAALIVILF